jgi:hypothetical protein
MRPVAPILLLALLTPARLVAASGEDCPYDEGFRSALAARNFEPGPNGASILLGYIERDCSAQSISRARKLMSDTLAKMEREQTAERQRRERAAAEAKAAEERRQTQKRIWEEKLRAEELRHLDEVDQKAWDAVAQDVCRAATSLNACDSVKGYLAALPAGRHVQEAEQCLKDAEPQLSALRDEADWAGAGVASCRRPSDSDACDGVATYIGRYPSGVHIAEAQRTMKAVSSKIARLKAQEEARAATDEAKTEARAAAEEAIKSLCSTVAQLAQVEGAEKMQRRIDAESGTVSYSERRQTATARIYLRDRRQTLLKTVERAGMKFDQGRDCSSRSSPDE